MVAKGQMNQSEINNMPHLRNSEFQENYCILIHHDNHVYLQLVVIPTHITPALKGEIQCILNACVNMYIFIDFHPLSLSHAFTFVTKTEYKLWLSRKKKKKGHLEQSGTLPLNSTINRATSQLREHINLSRNYDDQYF